MTKSKAYSIRQILQLQGEDPDSQEPEIVEMKQELDQKSVLELLNMIKELRENPVPTFFGRVGSCT
jgi:hypothetical protein